MAGDSGQSFHYTFHAYDCLSWLVARALCLRSGCLLRRQRSGGGLRPQDHERLFVPFYTTKPHGMGMGLFICRSIIEDHGGRLWATRHEPRGALFQFAIPATSGGS